MTSPKALITALIIGSAGCAGDPSGPPPRYDDLAGIALSSARHELEVGDSVAASVTGISSYGLGRILPLGPPAEWSSNLSGVVRFSSRSGGSTYIAGVNPGSCYVIVSASGYTATEKFTVFPQVASFSISFDNPTVVVGDTMFVRIAIAWKSGAPANGTRPFVSTVEGYAPGMARLTAASPANGETIKLIALSSGPGVLTAYVFGQRYSATAPFTITPRPLSRAPD